MSAELSFVFVNVFENVFKYDEKYDKLEFIVDSFNVMNYHIGIRRVWYKFYPVLLRKYKNLEQVYDEEKLMHDMESDESMPFIPMKLISDEDIEKRVFHKLLEEDYEFLQSKNANDGKDYKFNHMTQYDIPSLNLKGWNLNDYLDQNLLTISDLKNCKSLNHLLPKYAVEYISTAKEISKCWEIFTNDKCNELLHIDELMNLDEKLIKQIVDVIISNYYPMDKHGVIQKLTDLNLLKYCDMYLFEEFDIENIDVARLIFQRMSNVESNEYIPSDVLMSILIRYKLNDSDGVYSFDPTTFSAERLFEPPFNTIINDDQRITLMIENPDLVDLFLKCRNELCSKWIAEAINKKQINKDNWNDIWNKYKDYPNVESMKPRYCAEWIITYREEPPLEIYIPPGVGCGARGVHGTIADIWCKYVCSDVPKEMTSMSYYEYMIMSKGKKRNPNNTTMYTFFSNSDENKIIFCESDIELMEPARARYHIELNYDLVKPFLHEEIETNGICSFTHLTKDDWNKVAGRECDYDVVCFSEMKNINRERTPIKDVLEYLTNAIELKFGIQPIQIQ